MYLEMAPDDTIDAETFRISKLPAIMNPTSVKTLKAHNIAVPAEIANAAKHDIKIRNASE